MQNIIIETGCGDIFSRVAERAKRFAIDGKTNCQFDFNGITVIVSASTDLDKLDRDYGNSFIMDWKSIGPLCSTEYSLGTTQELKRRRDAQEKQQLQQRNLWALKEKESRRLFAENIKGVEFVVVDSTVYQDWKDKNNDGYGGACFEFAESWAKLMQKELLKGKQVKDIADKTSHELSYIGITGFQYGMVINILSKCWEHGEDLRKWHNKEYNHEGDGVVNPAILNISTK